MTVPPWQNKLPPIVFPLSSSVLAIRKNGAIYAAPLFADHHPHRRRNLLPASFSRARKERGVKD
jgi:hypothetical protein